MKFDDTLKKTTMIDLKVGNVVALMGESGIGKSSYVEAIAAEMDTKAFVLPCNQLADKADLTGARLVPYTKTNGEESHKQVFYPHEIVQQAIDYAKDNPREWPILFLDEINRTTPDVTSAALTLVTLRRLGREELPKNLRLMVAGNDKGNINALDEASLSRFAIYSVEPDAQTFMDIQGDDLNPWVRTVLTANPELIFCRAEAQVEQADDDDDDDGNVTVNFTGSLETGEEMNQFTTPRTAEYVSKWLNAHETDDLKAYLATPSHGDVDVSLLQEMLEAHTGRTQFTTNLISVMSQDFINNTSQNTASVGVSVPKPNCYDDLITATSIDELNDKINQLTAREVSGAVLYAIYDRRDNARMIEHLAPAVPQLEGEHLRVLIDLVRTDSQDQQNLDAFVATGSPSAQAVAPTLAAFQ